MPAVRVDYPRVPLVVENTGHVVEVPQPADAAGTLRFGTDVYRLVQWHVHAPSEHVVNGHRADLEIHLVHQDATGSTVVLAVFADLARSGRGPETRGGTAGLLRRTVRAAPDKAGEAGLWRVASPGTDGAALAWWYASFAADRRGGDATSAFPRCDDEFLGSRVDPRAARSTCGCEGRDAAPRTRRTTCRSTC